MVDNRNDADKTNHESVQEADLIFDTTAIDSSITSPSAPTDSEAAAPAPRKFKRKLTMFLAQEMLYEFAVGTLDSERHSAVEEFVAGDRECQAILESIRGSLVYAEKLSGTDLKPEVLAHIRESENVVSLSRRYSKWHTWPDSMRWSIVAVGVSIIVAGTVSVIPWQKISQTAQHTGPESVEVAKIPVESNEQFKTLADNSEADSSAQEGSGDEVDVADSGSGDTDDSSSGDTAEASKLTPAQLAKQAQEERRQAKADAAARKLEEEAARKAEARERKVAAHGGKGHETAEAEDMFTGHALVTAPISLIRKQMPLIAGLMDKLFVTPLGVLPQETKPKAVAKNEASANAQAAVDDEASKKDAAIASSSPIEKAVEVTAVKTAEVSAVAEPTAKPADTSVALNQPRHSGGVESDAETAGESAVPSHAPLQPTMPLGGAAANGTTALTISQIPETAPKGGIKPKGFVYRAFMNLDDLDTLGPKVTQLIQELGGVKAGEVELGWKKGNSVRYYHFSMPEESQEKLLEQLQTYGPVRISKDPHPRIMPKGQVRFILWVESSKSAH